jgi:hypothetical protein
MENVAKNKSQRRTFLKAIGGLTLGTAAGTSVLSTEAQEAQKRQNNSNELTLNEKTQRILSVLTPEELESIATCVSEGGFLPRVGNAGLAMMLLMNLFNQENQQ